MTEGVINARGLCKSFGATRALNRFDLQVSPAEVHGFLGPNGAGKTTTLRILLGLVQRDEGDVAVLGRDPWDDAVALHRDMAYVPGDVQLWPSLTGGETIDLLLRMRQVDGVRRDDLVARFELDLSMKVGDYSKGNRQKVALVAALAAEVPLYLFDEPTDGLDPLMAQVYRECVAEIKQRGATVLLSSHIMSEVEAVADRITIIRSGRNVETGTLAELRHLTRTRVTATTARPVAGLAGHRDVFDLQVAGDQVTCDVGPVGLPVVLGALNAAGVTTLDCRPPSLEEIFLRHYGADSRMEDADQEPGGSGEAVEAVSDGPPARSGPQPEGGAEQAPKRPSKQSGGEADRPESPAATNSGGSPDADGTATAPDDPGTGPP